MAAITTFTASSRLFYALARDNAFPMKKQFMTLNRFQAPYWGVWTSVLIGCIISCAYIGSAIAVSRPNFLMHSFVLTVFALSQFNAILSSAAISVMLSYLQPIIIRVFWPDSFVILTMMYSNHSWLFLFNLAFKTLDLSALENGRGQSILPAFWYATFSFLCISVHYPCSSLFSSVFYSSCLRHIRWTSSIWTTRLWLWVVF